MNVKRKRRMSPSQRAQVEFLRESRAKLGGLTQVQLSRLLGVSERTVIRYEDGDPMPHAVRMLVNMMVAKREKER